MSSRPRSKIAFFIYGGSVLLHAALGVGAGMLPKPKTMATVAIQLAEEKRKKQPPKPPEPPPPPAESKPKPRAVAAPQAQAQAKIAAEPKAEAPAAAPAGIDGFADLGIALGNGGGSGFAVPAAARPAAAEPTATASATHKVQQLTAAQGEACTEPVVPPKRTVPVAPKYTMEARQAEIEGVVHVEVTVDETGRVVAARILSGLGYGLDESALAAAKQTAFEPATRCGKPVVGTKKISFRFEQT